MSTEYCGLHEEPLYYRGTCESCDKEVYEQERKTQSKAWTRQYEKGIEDERERFKEVLEKLRIRFMDDHNSEAEHALIEAIYLIYNQEETE